MLILLRKGKITAENERKGFLKWIKADRNGFRVSGIDREGDPFLMEKSVPSMYFCHIEYEYLGKFGDCIDLNTLEDTWYIYPHDCDFAVTRIALATEELYCTDCREKGIPIRSGLA